MWSDVFSEFILHHRFVIGPVAQIHLRNRIPFEDNQVRTDAVEEPAVVAHDQGCPCEFFESFFEGTQGVDIQIVGWLIEQ